MKQLLPTFAFMFPSVLFAADQSAVTTYCHGNTRIQYSFEKADQANDIRLTVNGKQQKAISSYSWFGSKIKPPENFKFAILGRGDFDPLLVFDEYLIDKKQKNIASAAKAELD